MIWVLEVLSTGTKLTPGGRLTGLGCSLGGDKLRLEFNELERRRMDIGSSLSLAARPRTAGTVGLSTVPTTFLMAAVGAGFGS